MRRIGLLPSKFLLLAHQGGHAIGDVCHLGKPIGEIGKERDQLVDLGSHRPHRVREGRMFQWGAQWPGDALDHRDPRRVEHLSCHLVQGDHVRRIAHIVVGFDHEHVAVELAHREMPVGGRIALVRRHVVGYVDAVVVVGPIRRKRDRTDHHHDTAHHKNTSGPPHGDGTHLAPNTRVRFPFRVKDAKATAECQHRGPEGKGCRDRHESRGRARQAHRVEVIEAGELQAECRAGNGQA